MLFQHLELTGAGALICGATAEARPLPSWLAAACGHRVTSDMKLRADPFGGAIGTLQAGDRVLLRGGPLDPVEPSDAFGPDTRGRMADLNVPDAAHVREEDGYLWARVRVLRSGSEIEAGTVGAMAIKRVSDGRTYVDGDGVLAASGRQSLAEGAMTALEAPVAAGAVLGWTGPFGPEPGSASLPPLSDTAKKLMRRHLGRAGQIASLQIPRANLVHWEVFSEDPVFGMEQRSADGSLRDGIDPDETAVVPIWWQRAEDLDDDLAIDSAQVLEALEEVQELKNERFPWLPSRAASWFEEYDELSQTEVLRFYMDGYGARLQTCACRFHTAWGLADAESTATEAGWDVASTQALQWWDDVSGAIYGFPNTKHVWHYPPIEALRAVHLTEYVSLDQLSDIWSTASSNRIQRFGHHLQNTLRKYDINTPRRTAHFLAQVGHESARLHYTEEIASGEAYEGRADLGNTEEGDGKRFKGRGLIQLTGRANYESYGNAIGLELTKNENWNAVSKDPRLATDVAGWFWNRHGLNKHADDDEVRTITRAINGGYNGLEDRKTILNRAKSVLGVKSVNEETE